MNAFARLPFFHRSAQVLLALIAFTFVMYIGQEIIVPLVFALVLAILLNPVVEFLVRHKWKRVIAISVAVLLLVIVVMAIMYFVAVQVAHFRDSLPQLREKAGLLFTQTLDWLSERFNVSKSQINKLIESKKVDGLSAVGSTLGGTILSLSNLLVVLFLVPVYIFLFLYYKALLLNFVTQVFSDEHSESVREVLDTTKNLIQSYLVGLLIEMVIVAILNSVGLLIIGVEYAVALGVIGALLNLIPYIGGIIAIALPFLMAVIGGSYMSGFAVIAVYSIIQLIDNNFLVPMIVASKVKINALFSIIVVLIGGAVWGVAGMFLAIPLTAIVKVIFDYIPGMQPYGAVMGDEFSPEKLELPDIKKAEDNSSAS